MTTEQKEFKREEILETQFEDRYGRAVEVHRAIHFADDGSLNHVEILVVEGQDTYTITEYFKQDQSTDYVLAGKDGSPRRFNSYLPAEVFVADLIGQKKRMEKNRGNS